MQKYNNKKSKTNMQTNKRKTNKQPKIGKKYILIWQQRMLFEI